MKREEYLAWAKERALGQESAKMMWISFLSDMQKNKELKDHLALALGQQLNIAEKTKEEVAKYISDCN